MKYQVFIRTWWKIENGERVPNKGRKKPIRTVDTEAEARAICKDYNDNNHPGIFGRKAEFIKQ